MRNLGCILLAPLLSTQALAQDPLTIERQLNEILSQRLLDQEYDRQLQRYLDQQEAAYDRRMCILVGYRGPDIEQCVRDSAAARRWD